MAKGILLALGKPEHDDKDDDAPESSPEMDDDSKGAMADFAEAMKGDDVELQLRAFKNLLTACDYGD